MTVCVRKRIALEMCMLSRHVGTGDYLFDSMAYAP